MPALKDFVGKTIFRPHSIYSRRDCSGVKTSRCRTGRNMGREPNPYRPIARKSRQDCRAKNCDILFALPANRLRARVPRRSVSFGKSNALIIAMFAADWSSSSMLDMGASLLYRWIAPIIGRDSRSGRYFPLRYIILDKLKEPEVPHARKSQNDLCYMPPLRFQSGGSPSFASSL